MHTAQCIACLSIIKDRIHANRNFIFPALLMNLPAALSVAFNSFADDVGGGVNSRAVFKGGKSWYASASLTLNLAVDSEYVVAWNQ